MALAEVMRRHPTELRADLQRFFGVDIDRAMAGEHSAGHVAALVACLPSDSSTLRAENPDAAWTLESVLLAVIHNDLSALMWGMSDPKRRGPKPKRVGPSWMTAEEKRSLDTRVLSIDELMEELRKPRR